MEHSADHASSELKNTTYELFVGALSILSIFNLLVILLAFNQEIRLTAILFDAVLSVIFLLDFGYRLRTARSKSNYFFRQAGWADLLASVPAPQLKLLRLFRVWRAGRLMRRYGVRHLIREFLHDRADSALLSVLLLMILVLEFGSMGVLVAERSSPDANITNASDAVWWAYISITTVGYGDKYPVTNAGRLWGILVVTAGVGLFGVLSGYLANAFLRSQQPAADSAASEEASTVPPAHDLAGDLAAIKQLLEEQGRAQTSLDQRFEALERQLAAVRAGEINSREPPSSDGDLDRSRPT